MGSFIPAGGQGCRCLAPLSLLLQAKSLPRTRCSGHLRDALLPGDVPRTPCDPLPHTPLL